MRKIADLLIIVGTIGFCYMVYLMIKYDLLDNGVMIHFKANKEFQTVSNFCLTMLTGGLMVLFTAMVVDVRRVMPRRR